jgi:MoxR-like ATPase
MRPSALARALAALVPTKRPVFIWGPPGVGKSSLVRQAANTLKLSLLDLRASLLDPVDLRGLPKFGKAAAEWVPPVFLPRTGTGILFLDELTQAAAIVQSACLQLTLDRKLGEYELPPGWSVVAASNRPEDRAGGHRLISPLANRFIHLDMEVDTEDWQAWAVTSGIAPVVRAFLRFRPALLFQYESAANPRAFPSPRSWQFVSDVLAVTPAEALDRVVAGCVGEGAAAEFVAFLTLSRDLPDLDALLAHPDTAPVPAEPAVVYALVGAVVEQVRSVPAKAEAAVRYAARLPEEFGLLLFRDLLAVRPTLAALPVVQSWIARARAQGLFLAA